MEAMQSQAEAGLQFEGASMDNLDIEAVRSGYLQQGVGRPGLVAAHRSEPGASWNVESVDTFEQGKGDPFKQFRGELELIAAQWVAEARLPENWHDYCHYASSSPSLDFGNDTPPEGTRLPLFGSALVPKRPAVENGHEFILHVGGSVWSLDWCPQRPGWKLWHPPEGRRDKDFLAVGAHPASHSFPRRFGQPISDYHKLGEPLSGKVFVQIWEFCFPCEADGDSDEGTQENNNSEMDQSSLQAHSPMDEADVEITEGDAGRGRGRSRGRGRGRRGRGGRGTPSKHKVRAAAKRTTKRELELPRMALALAHEGGVTWDLKWQPAGGATYLENRECLRMGFLAMALGDGSLAVYDVPLPSVFGPADAKDVPLVVSLAPIFKCSELRGGGQRSIPLTLEWSTSPPYDLLLAGCHDGTVALWKFDPSQPAQDSRPLQFFIADSFALRTIAWAPRDSGIEGDNIITTGGHSGHLKFWDLRDPFRPLWELRLSRGQILCMDWLESPRCILVTLDDGTLRTISLNNALSDAPVTGKPFGGTQAQGVQSYYCSSFALWGIQVCRRTGSVAYCSADGSVLQFELSEKAIEKGGTRYREPHYLCGAFAYNKETRALSIVSQDYSGPVQMKRSLTEWGFTPRSKRGFTVSVNQEMRASSIAQGLLPPSAETPNKKKPKRGKKKQSEDVPADIQLLTADEQDVFPEVEEPQTSSGAVAGCKEEVADTAAATGKAHQPPNTVEEMPSKLNAVHRVKWNPNSSGAGWVCYGGAAGIIRCKRVVSQQS